MPLEQRLAPRGRSSPGTAPSPRLVDRFGSVPELPVAEGTGGFQFRGCAGRRWPSAAPQSGSGSTRGRERGADSDDAAATHPRNIMSAGSEGVADDHRLPIQAADERLLVVAIARSLAREPLRMLSACNRLGSSASPVSTPRTRPPRTASPNGPSSRAQPEPVKKTTGWRSRVCALDLRAS